MEQIGGKRFAVMTGSRDFVDMGNGLRMSLARNKTSANRLDIIYDAGTDLYNMRFYRKTFSKKTFESKSKDVEVHEGIFFDMLEEVFTQVTGLYTGSSRISGAWIFRKVLNLQHENCRCNMDVPSRWLERTVRDSPVRTN